MRRSLARVRSRTGLVLDKDHLLGWMNARASTPAGLRSRGPAAVPPGVTPASPDPRLPAAGPACTLPRVQRFRKSRALAFHTAATHTPAHVSGPVARTRRARPPGASRREQP